MNFSLTEESPGRDLKLKWSGKTISMVLANLPDGSWEQIHTASQGQALSDWVAVLSEDLNSNYYLSKDFVITVYNLTAIRFTEKEPGSAYTLEQVIDSGAILGVTEDPSPVNGVDFMAQREQGWEVNNKMEMENDELMMESRRFEQSPLLIVIVMHYAKHLYFHMRKAILCISLVIISTLCSAQNKQIDSLKAILESSGDDTTSVNLLITLSNRLINTDPDSSIIYSTQARELAEKLSYKRGLGYALKSIGMGHYFKGEYFDGMIFWQQSLSTFDSIGEKAGIANMSSNLGAVHFSQGDDTKAIEYYLRSLKVSEEINDKLRIATALINIGAVYSNKEATYDLALQFYNRALPLCNELGDDEAIGTVAVNMGEIFLERSQYDSSLYFFNTSLKAYEKVGSVKVAYTLNNIGKVYARQGDYEQAIKFQKEAIERAKSLEAKLEMTQAYLGLAKTYNAQGNIPLSIAAYREAQKTGEEIRIKNELKEIYEGLANVYAKTKDYTDAYKYQALYIVMRDSLYNEEMDKKLQSMTLSYDLEKKQGDIDLLTKDNALQELSLQRQRIATYAAGSTGFLLLVMAIGLFNRYKYVRKTKKIIEDEKERSDKLLLNILPHETANELKEKGTATPKHYDKVSVLFTDFKGFTKIAEKLTAQELIEELNYCFFEFDKIIDKHNLEKIKTIGDAYMCAGGIPAANDTNPVDIVRAGLEIKAFMERLKIDREAQGKDYWELRIGIHTGQVVAGVVGKNKFAYDIWGDAVNTASRMESSGIPGQVNISGTTYEFIKEKFRCTHRGKIQAKNKGEIDMYIVENEF